MLNLIDAKFRRNVVGWSKFRRKVLANRHGWRDETTYETVRDKTTTVSSYVFCTM
jgi:hypothetical protein